jgi:tetratricopeptide (TPR) repeat protein
MVSLNFNDLDQNTFDIDSDRTQKLKDEGHIEKSLKLIKKNKFIEAKKELEVFLKILRDEKIPDETKISDILTNLGLVHWRLEQMNLAHKYFFDAFELDRINFIYNAPQVLRNLNNIGLISKVQRRFEQAIQFIERVLILCSPDNPNKSTFHINLGLCFADSQNIDDARKSINRALEIDKIQKSEFNIARDLMYKGFILISFDKTNNVIDILKEALDYFRKLYSNLEK